MDMLHFLGQFFMGFSFLRAAMLERHLAMPAELAEQALPDAARRKHF
jgi:hypothetical protein